MLVFCICFWESGVCVMQLFPLSANTTITIVTWGTEKNVAVCGHSKLSFILHVASQEGWHQAVKSNKFAHLIGLLFMIEVHRLKCVVCQYSTWRVPHLYMFVCRGRKVVQKPKAMRI
jgi:hypothetical protein